MALSLLCMWIKPDSRCRMGLSIYAETPEEKALQERALKLRKVNLSTRLLLIIGFI